jgi:hypothetical protein
LLDVAEVITHPDYNWGPQSNPHDVGLLILAEPVVDITPANLPPYDGFLDELKAEGKLNKGSNKAKFTVVGYGGTLSWPPPQHTYEDERQFAISEYRALLKAWLRLSQNHATGDGGSCYGDSGGPILWTEPDGTEILVGIASWGDQPCVATGFNYRVDILETLSFLENDILGPTPNSGDYALWGGRGNSLFSTATSVVTLPNSPSPTLTFHAWYEIETGRDFAFVQVSTDGGQTWASLQNANTTFTHDPDADPDVTMHLPGFTGSSGGWEQETFDLSSYAGQEIVISFLYATDSARSQRGFYIDDIELTGYPLEDFEAGSGNWTLNGWVRTTGGY